MKNLNARQLLLVSLALVLTACGQQPSPTAQSDNTVVPATQPPPTAVPPTSAPADTPIPPTATTPSEPTWRSWAAGNTIYALTQHNGQMYAGGPGGVTVWNLTDGSVARRYTSGDGLPSAVVRALHVDEDGTLWVGTDDGLARFSADGSDVTTYTTTDGLDSNAVFAITRLRDELLIGTAYSYLNGGGLNRFKDGAWQSVRGFPSANPDERPGRLSYTVTSILEESPGVIWVATLNGVGRFDGQEWQRFSTAEGLPNNRVNLLFKDSNGTIWAATDQGAARFNGQNFETFRQLQNALGSGVYGITQDTDGQYWFAGSGGIVRYKPATADWEQFTQQIYDLPAYTLTRAVLGADGALYFGSDGGGLARYTGNDFATWAVPNIPSFSGLRRIVPNPVTGELLFVEADWIRADIYNPASQTWARVPDLPCGCGPLAFDAEGALWGGNENGLWIMRPDDTTQLTTEFGLPSNVVPAVTLTADGKAWVGTDSGLALIENETVTQVYTNAVGFSGSYIRKIFVASDNSVWVSTENNLSRLKPDGAWEHFTSGNPFSYDVQVNDIAEDTGGGIWVGTSGDAVYRYANGQWTHFDPNDPGVKLPSAYVLAVAAAPDGSVWLGTDSGAARFDGTNWSAYRVKDGLIQNRVLDVYVDAAGAVWFATSGGVSRYGP